MRGKINPNYVARLPIYPDTATVKDDGFRGWPELASNVREDGELPKPNGVKYGIRNPTDGVEVEGLRPTISRVDHLLPLRAKAAGTAVL